MSSKSYESSSPGSQEIGVTGHKSELIRNLCRALGADEYLAGPSGRDYLDLADFAAHGIAVRFFTFDHPTYDQGAGAFLAFYQRRALQFVQAQRFLPLCPSM